MIAGFRINRLVQNDASDCSLDVRARTAEPIIKIYVSEGGIDVVAPKPVNRLAADPNTFRVAGRAVYEALGCGKFVLFRSSAWVRRLLHAGRCRRVVLGPDGGGRQQRGCGKEPHGGGSRGSRPAGTAHKTEHSVEHGSLNGWVSSQLDGRFPGGDIIRLIDF